MKSEIKRGFLTRRTFGLTFSTAALTSALPLRFARGDTAVTLKLGHSLTRGSHYDVAAVAFAESLKAKSGGKIEVQIFPQSQQCVGLIDHFKRDLTTCIALQIDSDGARTGPSTTLSGRSAIAVWCGGTTARRIRRRAKNTPYARWYASLARPDPGGL